MTRATVAMETPASRASDIDTDWVGVVGGIEGLRRD